VFIHNVGDSVLKGLLVNRSDLHLLAQISGM
jgi:hypothetical protein